MGQKSTVLKLPSSVRRELDRALMRGTMSIAKIRDFIASCDNVEHVPSHSALDRYAASFKETAEAMRTNRALARALAQELGPESVEGEQGRLLVEILRGFVFKTMQQRVTDPDAKFDAAEISKVARSLKDLSHAMHLEYDSAKRIREEERKKVEAEVRLRADELCNVGDLEKLSNEELKKKIAELATGRA